MSNFDGLSFGHHRVVTGVETAPNGDVTSVSFTVRPYVIHPAETPNFFWRALGASARFVLRGATDNMMEMPFLLEPELIRIVSEFARNQQGEQNPVQPSDSDRTIRLEPGSRQGRLLGDVLAKERGEPRVSLPVPRVVIRTPQEPEVRHAVRDVLAGRTSLSAEEVASVRSYMQQRNFFGAPLRWDGWLQNIAPPTPRPSSTGSQNGMDSAPPTPSSSNTGPASRPDRTPGAGS